MLVRYLKFIKSFICRDHSDSMWNESQTTVLQIDSGTENGTVISSSDLSSLAASPGALALLTPTSRRKQLLLLQHQQRSSLDTDALDEEFDASQVSLAQLKYVEFVLKISM